jgi:hypothetical protein
MRSVIASHLKYGRRPELRGSVKCEIVDESDVEWDEDIELRFGRRAFHGPPEPPPPMDAQF